MKKPLKYCVTTDGNIFVFKYLAPDGTSGLFYSVAAESLKDAQREFKRNIGGRKIIHSSRRDAIKTETSEKRKPK